MADPQFNINCGHCAGFFWSYNISATRVCPDCFSYGHHGNGGDCWKCRSVTPSTDEAALAVDEEDD